MERRTFLKLVGIAPFLKIVLDDGDAAGSKQLQTVKLGEFQVAGFQYHDGMRPEIARHLAIGQPLLIERDHQNPYDPCALKILTTHRNMLGFIPRNQNRTAATLADQRFKLFARIVAVHNDADPWERLMISLWATLPDIASAEIVALEARS
ncbi:MAG: HIRAN domain-containing protein [Desulfobacter sp.]